ncbi:hypothetical protein CCP3SC1AL1_310011 [Gammaproteobacteria bacterium]
MKFGIGGIPVFGVSKPNYEFGVSSPTASGDVPYSSYPEEALLYITNSLITNDVYKTAICDFVAALKANSLWALGYFLHINFDDYAKSKLNLFNPVDSDAAYRQTEGGTGMTYSNALGASFHTTGYFNTHFNPHTDAAVNDFCMGFVKTENNDTVISGDIGAAADPSIDPFYILATSPDYGGATRGVIGYRGTGKYFYNTPLASETGIYSIGSNASNKYMYRRNGITIGADIVNYSDPRPNLKLFVGSINYIGSPTVCINGSIKISYGFKGLTRAQHEILELALYDLSVALGVTFPAITRANFVPATTPTQVYGMGESIIEGYFATDRAVDAYFPQLMTAKGWTGTNLGVQATTLIYAGVGDDSLYDLLIIGDTDGNYANVPRRTKNNKYIIIEHGINDCAFETAFPATFNPTTFGTAWDDIINKLDLLGWSGSNVVVIGENHVKPAGWTFYGTTEARYQDFVAVTQAKCTAQGYKYVSIKAAQLAGNNFHDDFHPNDLGHDDITNDLITKI